MRVPEEASSVCRGCYQTVISPRRCFGIDGGVWEFDTVIGGVIRCKTQGPGMLNVSTIRSTKVCLRFHLTFHCPTGSGVKNLPANAGDEGLILGSGRSPGEGSSNPLQYSCLENSMGRGAWQATIHLVSRSQTGCD